MSTQLIYFDNSATSWPKPAAVMDSMREYLEQVGGNPGRSGHQRSIDAARLVYEVREVLASLMGIEDPLRVVFTKNVTEALNLALCGLLRPGDHVITGSMEHNSVMRPLRALERAGVDLTVVRCSAQGEMDPADIERAIGPATRLIALTHASNVAGTLMPIEEVGRIARRHDLLFLVDAAQTAGAYPVHMERNLIDLLGFTGHKGLLGPQGTGGLVIGERVPVDQMAPLIRGGTGSRSEEEEQPTFLPDKYESGTQNVVGLAGLGASARFIAEVGVDAVRRHEAGLTERLLAGLTSIEGARVYGTTRAERQTATVAFNLQGLQPSDVGLALDEEYGILCRVGLHCSPAAHRTLGTFPFGAVRFGLGYFSTAEEVDRAIQAVAELAAIGLNEEGAIRWQ